MNKKKLFTRIGIGTIVGVLLVGLYVGSVLGKNGKYFECEYQVRDMAIKTFNIDPKAEVYFTDDVFENDGAKTGKEIGNKLALAIQTLTTKEKIHVKGDIKPVYFVEGNKALIAIKHANGTISLTEFDISGEKPVKTKHLVKEAIR